MKEESERYFKTVDHYCKGEAAEKDKGGIEEIVSQFCKQIGSRPDGDPVDPASDVVTVVEVSVHDNMD